MDMSLLARQMIHADDDSIRGFAADVATMGKLHIELFAHEAQCERRRLKRAAVLFTAVSIAAGLTLFFSLAAIILLCWDTSFRTHAVIGVPLLMAAASAAGARWIYRESASHEPFKQSTDELKKDGAWLMNLL